MRFNVTNIAKSVCTVVVGYLPFGYALYLLGATNHADQIGAGILFGLVVGVWADTRWPSFE